MATAIVEDTQQNAALHTSAPNRYDYSTERQYERTDNAWSTRTILSLQVTTMSGLQSMNINVFEDNAAKRRS